MDVRVVPLVVEGSVPFEMAGRYLQSFGQLPCLGTEQIPPTGGGVISQPLGVLPAQGDDERPHRPPVIVQLPRHLGENNWFPGGGEQAMCSQTFCPGAGGHVRHVALHPRGFRPLPGGDVLGVATTGAGFVVLEVAEFRDEQGHTFLLFLPL